MNIAFISYEYPPDTADGGIATYVQQAANMLVARGHHVEVFAGSRSREGCVTEHGIMVHRVEVPEPHLFSSRIAGVFADRHATVDFTVLEGPDFGADARDAVRLAPDVPLVVKLHAPRFLIDRINAGERSLAGKGADYLRALRRGRLPHSYDAAGDPERNHALGAAEVVAPSRALGEIVAAEWRLDRARMSCVPLPYAPSEALLAIPTRSRPGTVLFFGRLEVGKGVVDLARAIPRVLARNRAVRFRFVGQSEDSPRRGVGMREYLQGMLRGCESAVEFTAQVPLANIPSVLATADICVFPSIWENFPLVCLEAMAAGRAIVGSNSGGMREQLDDGAAGVLIPPHRPDAIADSVIALLDQPERCAMLGRAARERVLAEYNVDRIGALQEASYRRAVVRVPKQPARMPGISSVTDA